MIHERARSTHELRERVGGGQDVRLGVTSEHEVGDPEVHAVDDRERHAARQVPAGADEIERLLDGHPARGPVGAVPRDPRLHVPVERLGGGDERDAIGGERARERGRVSALAAPGAAQDEVRPVACDGRALPRDPEWWCARPGRSPGSRIVLLPTPSRPALWPVALVGFVPDYSDGVAADSHRLPCGPAHGGPPERGATVSGRRWRIKPPDRPRARRRAIGGYWRKVGARSPLTDGADGSSARSATMCGSASAGRPDSQ